MNTDDGAFETKKPAVHLVDAGVRAPTPTPLLRTRPHVSTHPAPPTHLLFCAPMWRGWSLREGHAHNLLYPATTREKPGRKRGRGWGEGFVGGGEEEGRRRRGGGGVEMEQTDTERMAPSR